MAVSTSYDFVILCFIFVFAESTPNYKFNLISTGEHLVYSDVFDDTRSSVQCGAHCAQKRQNNGLQPMCEAYSYTTSSGRCQLYVAQTNGTDASGVNVYKYLSIDQDLDDGFDYTSIGGHTFIFYISSSKFTFQGAKDHCSSLGSYLVNFDSKEEYDALVTLLSETGASGRVWVGAHDMDNEGVWMSDLHNTPIDDAIWTFVDGEPNDYMGGEDCGAIRLDSFLLNDVPCQYNYYAACERTP